jgi:hypothetical protein
MLQQPAASKAYESTQSIELQPAVDRFDSRTDPDALVRMLRQYFSVAEQCACGLVQMRWSAGRPSFVLLWPAVTMIQMGEPTFEQTPERRAVHVAVEGGLLVSPASGASLGIAFTRGPNSLLASVELRHYTPRFGQLVGADWVYRQTQVRVHEWVGLRYVRQLRRQWLAQADGG